MKRVLPISPLLLVLLLAAGCGFMRSPTTPMPSEPPVAPTSGRSLLVMLPGFGDTPAIFAEHGFPEAARAIGDFDAVAADAHYGYYRTFTVLDRLRADIIEPARRAGYERIWLVGVSMGGFGALAYAMEHPDDIDGVIALAPYLGDGDLIDEVDEAGGLASWEPGDLSEVADERDRFMRQLWAWLKTRRPDTGPAVFLGWGRGDRLAKPASLVARTLPSDAVEHRAGGHDWEVWRPLFDTLAARAFGQSSRGSIDGSPAR